MEIKGVYEKRGWFYYQPPMRDRKREPAIALKTKDPEEAVNRAFALFQNSALTAQSKDAMMTLLPLYLADMIATKGHTAKTSHTTKNTLTALATLWENPKVTAITRERILQWRSELAGRPGLAGEKMSEASIGSYLLRLRGFLSWLVLHKHLREHPMASIKLPKVKKTRKERFLTVSQREILLENPPNHEIEFILYFGFFAGLRFEEMLAMEAGWIVKSGEGMVLTVQKTQFWQPKDKELRTIVLHPRVVAFINRYGLRHPFMLMATKDKWKPSPNYRFNPKKAFKKYVKSHGMGWASYHTLRHSFATHMAMAGAMMIEIADALGDGLKVTEETYVAYSPHAKRTITSL